MLVATKNCGSLKVSLNITLKNKSRIISDNSKVFKQINSFFENAGKFFNKFCKNLTNIPILPESIEVNENIGAKFVNVNPEAFTLEGVDNLGNPIDAVIKN